MPINKLWKYTFSRAIDDSDQWWYDPNNPRITLIDTKGYLPYLEEMKSAREAIAQVQAANEHLTQRLEDAYMQAAFPNLKAVPAPKDEEFVELELF